MKRRQQRARAAEMTPEERARHDEWHRTHKPGSAAARAQGRQSRAAREWLAGLGAGEASAPTREQAERAEAIAKLRAELERLEASAAAPSPNVDDLTGGLFD